MSVRGGLRLCSMCGGADCDGVSKEHTQYLPVSVARLCGRPSGRGVAARPHKCEMLGNIRVGVARCSCLCGERGRYPALHLLTLYAPRETCTAGNTRIHHRTTH